jgi:hypothetical protein
MDRRRAIAIAAATAATVVGAGATLAANLGLLGFGGTAASPMGRLDAGQVSRSVQLPEGSTPGAGPDVTVRYEDVYLPVPSGTAPVVSAASPPTGAVSPADQMTTSSTGYGAQDDSSSLSGEDDSASDSGHDDHDGGFEDEGHEEEDDD